MVRLLITHLNHKTSDWKCFQLLFVSSGSDITKGMDSAAKTGKYESNAIFVNKLIAILW